MELLLEMYGKSYNSTYAGKTVYCIPLGQLDLFCLHAIQLSSDGGQTCSSILLHWDSV